MVSKVGDAQNPNVQDASKECEKKIIQFPLKCTFYLKKRRKLSFIPHYLID